MVIQNLIDVFIKEIYSERATKKYVSNKTIVRHIDIVTCFEMQRKGMTPFEIKYNLSSKLKQSNMFEMQNEEMTPFAGN